MTDIFPFFTFERRPSLKRNGNGKSYCLLIYIKDMRYGIIDNLDLHYHHGRDLV